MADRSCVRPVAPYVGMAAGVRDYLILPVVVLGRARPDDTGSRYGHRELEDQDCAVFEPGWCSRY